VIRCERLAFTYPDGTQALDNVDLEIRAGECVAIIGQNGSGKSTLVRHWNGLLRPTAGEVVVDGKTTRSRRVAELARIVGLAFQDPDRQIFASRCRTEVAFGARNVGLKGQEFDAAVESALSSVGLRDAADQNPYDIGYSRRKLLSLASILAMRTPVVVLDEPTTGQDARGIALVREIVSRLSVEGRTVVTISHDIGFVAETFDRVVVMSEGRVIGDDRPETIFAEWSWPMLASTHVEPPIAARVGAALGLGSTPSEASLLAAVRGR
jgi:energy-coupling factor transport system ATP-binding protein